jgi:hypothetical protein
MKKYIQQLIPVSSEEKLVAVFTDKDGYDFEDVLFRALCVEEDEKHDSPVQYISYVTKGDIQEFFGIGACCDDLGNFVGVGVRTDDGIKWEKKQL